MVQLDFDTRRTKKTDFLQWLQDKISRIPADSIVRVRVGGRIDAALRASLGAESLSTYVPQTMNVAITIARDSH